MVPMSIGAPPRSSSRSSRSRAIWPGRSRAARPLREPAVAEGGCAAYGRGRRAADPDRRARLAHRARCDPHVPRRKARSGQLGELVGEGAGQRGHGFVGMASPLSEVARQELVLLGHVAGAHADDEAATREAVDGGELLGRPERMALGEDQHVGEQMRARRHGGQPAEGGRRVVPDGPHGVGQSARYGRVVADAEVEETRLVCHPGDPRQLGRTGHLLPVSHVERGLGLNRELHAVHDLPLGDGAHDVGGDQRRVGHGWTPIGTRCFT